jgi:hypothetical protein
MKEWVAFEISTLHQQHYYISGNEEIQNLVCDCEIITRESDA